MEIQLWCQEATFLVFLLLRPLIIMLDGIFGGNSQTSNWSNLRSWNRSKTSFSNVSKTWHWICQHVLCETRCFPPCGSIPPFTVGLRPSCKTIRRRVVSKRSERVWNVNIFVISGLCRGIRNYCIAGNEMRLTENKPVCFYLLICSCQLINGWDGIIKFAWF